MAARDVGDGRSDHASSNRGRDGLGAGSDRSNAGRGRDNRGGAVAGKKKANASGMSSVAADHLVAMGRISTPSIPAGGVAQGNYPSQHDAYNDYAKAVGAYDSRGFLDRAADWLGGGFYDLNEPMAGNPRSFAGGTYHSSSNPGRIAGGLAGMFAGPLAPMIGPAAGAAYTAAGLPQAWHGGLDQPDLRNGPFGNTDAEMGASFADIGGTGGGLFGGGNTYASGTQPGQRSTQPNMAGLGNPNGNGGLLAQNQPFRAAASAPNPFSAPTAPTAQQGLNFRPQMAGGGAYNIPGGKPYTLNFNPYRMFG
jgi:hypothetical protein